jgi:exodeoxyribonuclease-3
VIKIVTWNINSIRMRIELLLEWMRENNPDILLLQEIKCVSEQFPYQQIEDLGYNVAVFGQKSYNGVAIISRFPLEDVSHNFPNCPIEEDARYIEAIVTINGQVLRVASLYVPNGQEMTSDKFQYKLKFLTALSEHLRLRKEFNEQFVIGGDYNISPADIDVYDPSIIDTMVCFNRPEQKMFRGMIGLGYFDAYRLVHPDKKEYSWWDYRGGSFQRNLGMRIDHFLLSGQIADKLHDVTIDKEVRGKEKTSDHSPVIGYFK